MAETLAAVFAIGSLGISAVSFYYVYRHVQKLREVEFE